MPPVVAPTTSPWEFTLDAGYLHQADTDIDRGGSFSVDRANLELGAIHMIGRGRKVGVSLGYGYHDYTFDDYRVDPWEEVHALTLSFPIQMALSETLSIFALPSVRANYEDGADISDSITAGLLLGAAYKFSDNLYIGPGLGISSELEDDLNVFPILLIKWKISDSLELKTGRGLGASQGPGVGLHWQATDKWTLSLGTRYERLRFRLNDSGFSPDGVGEEKGVPVYLSASYKFSESAELSVYGGVKFAGSLEVENSSGDSIYKSDHDTAPFFGFRWSSKF